MSTPTTNISTNPAGAYFMLLLLALFSGAVIAGVKLPLISGIKPALVIFLVLGMGLCSPGIGRVAGSNAWLHPLTILAIVAGILILVVFTFGMLGKPLFFITTGKMAFITMTALVAFKFVVSQIHALLR